MGYLLSWVYGGAVRESVGGVLEIRVLKSSGKVRRHGLTWILCESEWRVREWTMCLLRCKSILYIASTKVQYLQVFIR